jgi:prepilin-type N-terminal cleavage/methylation domain-containing protein
MRRTKNPGHEPVRRMWRTGLEGMLITARQPGRISENDMKRSMGFTLVELLVVIAIIALLISILAPSLKTAKDLAKQVMCSTNLHGAAMGVTTYAAANNGGVPPWTRPGTNDTMNMRYNFDDGYSPVTFVCTYRLDPSGNPYLDPSNGKPKPYGMLSLLLYYGMIENANLIYCPAIVDGQLCRAAWPDPYGTTYNPVHYERTDGGEKIMKCSYPFNPHCWLRASTPMFTYTKQENFPSDEALAIDPLYNIYWGDSEHKVSGAKSPTWNRAYIDAHVSAKISASAYLQLEQADPGDKWADFDKALSFIK